MGMRKGESVKSSLLIARGKAAKRRAAGFPHVDGDDIAGLARWAAHFARGWTPAAGDFLGYNPLNMMARTLTCPTAALKGAQAALIAGRPVSKSNELDALNLLRKMASYRLEGYAGGSAEDDDARLAAGTGSAAWRMVVRMRRAEKRLLRGALGEIDRRISRVAKDGIGAVRRPPKPSERAEAGT